MCKRTEIVNEMYDKSVKMCQGCAEFDDGEKCPEPCEDFKEVIKANSYIVRKNYAHVVHERVWEAV